MPELPEVENVRKELNKIIVGQKILNFIVLNNKSANFKSGNLTEEIIISSVDRYGKLLVIGTNQPDNNFLIHLKMTGQLIYSNAGFFAGGGHTLSSADLDLPNNHTRIIIELEKGRLFFNDLRKFGYIKLVNREFKNKEIAKIGIEPENELFTLVFLVNLLKNRKITLKSLLLNQNRLAGLGNIYVDESCFEAGVLPWRVAGDLNEQEIKALHQAIKKIIKQAIKSGGTTFYSFRKVSGDKGGYQKKLMVYKRAGLPCLKCGNLIKKVKSSGRGTHFCPVCQK